MDVRQPLMIQLGKNRCKNSKFKIIHNCIINGESSSTNAKKNYMIKGQRCTYLCFSRCEP